LITKIEPNENTEANITCMRKGLVNESNNDKRNIDINKYTDLVRFLGASEFILKSLRMIKRIKLKKEKIPSVYPIILKTETGLIAYNAATKVTIL